MTEDESPLSLTPSTVCPACKSPNWYRTSTDRASRTELQCNDCGHSRALPKLRDLWVMMAYSMECPWCGGTLSFEPRTAAALGDADVYAIDGFHLEHGGETGRCEHVTIRWCNPPNTEKPVLLALD